MSRRKKHGGHEEEHENHERWLITYADMITLLLALFMMLYAMSVLDLKKFQSFQQAFTNGNGKHVHQLPGEGDPPDGEKRSPENVGATTGPLSETPPPIPPAGSAPVVDAAGLEQLKEKVLAALKAAGLDGQVSLEVNTRGLEVNVTSSVLFDTGSSALTPQGKELLGKLGPVLAGVGNDMVIEGHTDARPLNGTITNWELSTNRATAVLRDLLGTGIPASRVSASGFADTRPRAQGNTEEAYAQNRRVDVVVLAPPAPAATPTSTGAATPTTAPTPTGEATHEESKSEDSSHH
jgi:chemotaxis protein MotB